MHGGGGGGGGVDCSLAGWPAGGEVHAVNSTTSKTHRQSYPIASNQPLLTSIGTRGGREGERVRGRERG